MTTYTLKSTSDINLNREFLLLRENIARLFDTVLNRIFDLKPERAARRKLYFLFLFLFTGFLIGLKSYPLNLWAEHIQEIFLYLFNPAFFTVHENSPIVDFFIFVLRAFFDYRTFRFFPIFLVPFLVALQSAAIYLKDVFDETDINVSIARSFIWEVALSGSNKTIRVSAGEIASESRHSPTFLIGGPGRVIVDLDSVALFEKYDGTPHIIGPTGNLPGGKAILEGFERFRDAFDLRDHFIDFLDPNSISTPPVKSRSLDGIPITATDVRFMYSIHRDHKSNTKENPYTFVPDALLEIIYKSVSSVTPTLPNPSTYRPPRLSGMARMIRGKLATFMGNHLLTTYLASIGTLEHDTAKKLEQKIVEQAQSLTPSTEKAPEIRKVDSPPMFIPRHEITNMFEKFVKEFKDRGVELYWIGVGTWKTPVEIVSENHIEAWKLTLDNLRRGNENSLNDYKKESIELKMASLIQDVPIAAHQKALSKEVSHQNAKKELLLSYRQQLIEAAEFMREKNIPIPPSIGKAVRHIERLLAITNYHWVGRKR